MNSDKRLIGQAGYSDNGYSDFTRLGECPRMAGRPRKKDIRPPEGSAEARLVSCLTGDKTQAGLAAAVRGLTTDMVSKIVRAERRLKHNEVAAASKYLGVSVAWLLTGEGPKEADTSEPGMLRVPSEDVLTEILMWAQAGMKPLPRASVESIAQIVRQRLMRLADGQAIDQPPHHHEDDQKQSEGQSAPERP